MKAPLSPGVGQNARVHLPVGAGAALTPPRSGRDPDIASDLPVCCHQFFGALSVINSITKSTASPPICAPSYRR